MNSAPWPFGALRPHAYAAILADPAYRFRVYSAKGEGRSASHHYGTMSFEEIAALPGRRARNG